MRNPFAFLPRGYSSLADYISPAAFDVIDWVSALKKSATVSRQILTGGRVEPLCRDLKTKGLPGGIVLLHGDPTTPATTAAWPEPGERVLELYFRQILMHDRAFLDLRSERFELTSSGPDKAVLCWRPNGLWVAFSKVFLSGIRQVYAGFYGADKTLLEDGLGQLGLHGNGLSDQSRARLLRLLEDHFGGGRDHPMEFRIQHFMQSFDNLFLFLRQERIRLSEDFLFLGVMLLTLYLHLESLGGCHDVRAAYGRALAACTTDASAWL